MGVVDHTEVVGSQVEVGMAWEEIQVVEDRVVSCQGGSQVEVGRRRAERVVGREKEGTERPLV